MAYSTSSPPFLLMQGIGGVGKVWGYRSTDAQTVVDGSGYITNAADLGMAATDLVWGSDTDSSPKDAWFQTVNTVSTSADLTNGVAVTSTNSD